MTEFHSIWLMPSQANETWFSETVADLAGRFGTPVFQPHLTLVEDMPRSSAELAPLLAQVGEGARAIEMEIAGVTGSDLYFRSLYAAFPKNGDLLALKESSILAFGKGDIEGFMPHVSLAYGVPDGPDKERAIAQLHAAMTGAAINFDRIAIVSSSRHTPLDQWKIVADIGLAKL
ncbi:MAG: 2'-5' RNA ligase family protein [Phyllobacterium sp.]